MAEFKRMSETEMEIMQRLWVQGTPLSTSELLAYFNDEKEKRWKIQTISTFLSRLTEKGFVVPMQKGRGYIFTPAVTHAQYKSAEAKNVLDELYDGSAKNFFAALYGGNLLTEKELTELKRLLAEK